MRLRRRVSGCVQVVGDDGAAGTALNRGEGSSRLAKRAAKIVNGAQYLSTCKQSKIADCNTLAVRTLQSNGQPQSFLVMLCCFDMLPQTPEGQTYVGVRHKLACIVSHFKVFGMVMERALEIPAVYLGETTVVWHACALSTHVLIICANAIIR